MQPFQNIAIAKNLSFVLGVLFTSLIASPMPATVQVDKRPELYVENQTLGALPATVTLRPFSVNIYPYPVQ